MLALSVSGAFVREDVSSSASSCASAACVAGSSAVSVGSTASWALAAGVMRLRSASASSRARWKRSSRRLAKARARMASNAKGIAGFCCDTLGTGSLTIDSISENSVISGRSNGVLRISIS